MNDAVGSDAADRVARSFLFMYRYLRLLSDEKSMAAILLFARFLRRARIQLVNRMKGCCGILIFMYFLYKTTNHISTKSALRPFPTYSTCSDDGSEVALTDVSWLELSTSLFSAVSV